MKVFVLNMRGQPLMPCSPAKARHLLKAGKAVVKRRTPFTIQLRIATGETKQNVTLGVDAGAKHVGLSATTEKEEVFASEVELRQDITGLLAARLSLRRDRRHRKTRYRAPRFLNRVRSKHKGWLAPSVPMSRASPLSGKSATGHTLLPVPHYSLLGTISLPSLSSYEMACSPPASFIRLREYFSGAVRFKLDGLPSNHPTYP